MKSLTPGAVTRFIRRVMRRIKKRKSEMKSWKTTAAGVGGLMTTLGSILNQLFDGNPATNPDWNLVLPILMTSLIGLFARDNGVSSEQAGAVKPEVKL